MTKPTITFRHGGDPKDLYLATQAVLRKAGIKNQVQEFQERGQNIHSFQEMLNLVLEYVNVERG